MQTTEQKLTNTLQYSFLILWKEDKQKWVVDCQLLKIEIEADTYKDALDKLMLKLLRHKFSDDFFDLIEQDKKDYLRE
ncbi:MULTISPECIES: hypothetical protein [Acinetobacter]|uniref:hypothetical protein n=1 Tax=Acinetobacter TaxID=469 RepID=UPI00128E5B84|nr:MULTISPECIES: hypothetical protein [Acinetobacter]MCU4608235.1 hypothetical protein [Acinetobacter ursingii]MPW43393.1 hypothetical protein [Acinetobacter guerrae]